jgi:hypothetical protein
VLGIPENEVSSKKPEDLIGRPVTFGVALKNGYKNISFVEGRGEAEAAAPVAVDPFGQNQF